MTVFNRRRKDRGPASHQAKPQLWQMEEQPEPVTVRREDPSLLRLKGAVLRGRLKKDDA